MEVAYLQPREFGVDEEGFYVVDDDDVLAGPFDTEDAAEDWVRRSMDHPSGLGT